MAGAVITLLTTLFQTTFVLLPVHLLRVSWRWYRGSAGSFADVAGVAISSRKRPKLWPQKGKDVLGKVDPATAAASVTPRRSAAPVHRHRRAEFDLAVKAGGGVE